MTDAFRLIAALTRQPGAVDSMLGERGLGGRDSVATTLITLGAGSRQQVLDDTGPLAEVVPLKRDKQS